jgi:hypothetical protein
LTLATAWKQGRHLLEDKYPWIVEILHCISATENASILAPYGTSLVTTHLTDDVDDTVTVEDTFSPPPDEQITISEQYDTTLGMQELEDAATEVQWRNDTGCAQSKFSNSVQIGGVMMNKSRAIAQHFRYVTSASSTDRLRCVA